MKATIVLVDEVYCLVQNLSSAHTKTLSDRFSLHAPNYFFNPRYKLGAWDGKIRFFHLTGKTYVYLLDKIIPDIIAFGYEIEIIDRRPETFTVTPPIIDDTYLQEYNVTLRPYQVKAVNSVSQDGYGIVQAATGAGKTIIIATLAKLYGEFGLKCLVIVPNKGLVKQTIEEGFDLIGLDTGGYHGMSKDLNHQHVVATWQSLKNAPHVVQQFQVIIVDEAHQQKANELTKLVSDPGKYITHRFGFTGTMPDNETDYMAVTTMLGPVRCVISAKELMDLGYLAQVGIEFIELKEDLKAEYESFIEENKLEDLTYKEFKAQYFPDYNSEKDFIYRKEDRRDFIAQFIFDLAANTNKGNTFILVDRVKYAQEIAAAIPGAHLVHRSDKDEAREEVYRLFQTDNNVIVVSTVQLVGTGLNIKRIFNLVLLDLGKSYTKIIQGIGRGTRTASDKSSFGVYDIHSDLKYSKKHAAERARMYTQESYPYTKKSINYQ